VALAARCIFVVAATLSAVALTPGPAVAGPPSSISQYVEVIPTSTGSTQSGPSSPTPSIGESEQARLRREQPKVAAALEQIAASGSHETPRSASHHLTVAGLDTGSIARILLLVLLVAGGSAVLARSGATSTGHRDRAAS
jgi:hypothetical protein